MQCAIAGAARTRHILAACTCGLDVAGVCDLTPEALAAAAAEYGLESARLSRDMGEMLHATRPEVVIVATTAPAQAELTCLAA